MTQDELRVAYAQATIFALPCQIVSNGDRDGIPNVLAEAMAMALPVVATNISGIPELVEHGVDGFLTPQKDVVALSNALATLLQDPALRRQLGRHARAKVCRIFDAHRTTLALRDLFLACLEKQAFVRMPQATQGHRHPWLPKGAAGIEAASGQSGE
jgi:glycosyltransferase involved in cell wall biosynthesis